MRVRRAVNTGVESTFDEFNRDEPAFDEFNRNEPAFDEFNRDEPTGLAPAQVSFNGPKGKFGHFDAADCDTFAGWAWDSDQPTQPVQVGIYDGDRLLSNVTADQYRLGLERAGVGDGKHGFSYAVPQALKDGKPHAIRIQITGSQVSLQNSPRSITCPSKQPDPGASKDKVR